MHKDYRIYLHLFTDCFIKIPFQFSSVLEIFMKQSVNKCRKINFCNIYVLYVSMEYHNHPHLTADSIRITFRIFMKSKLE